MNLTKFKTQLDKVNRYYEYIAQDGQLSNIERDTMMAYIRNMYELFFEEEAKTEAPKEVLKETSVVPKISTETVRATAPPVTVKKRPKLVFTDTPKTEVPKIETKKTEIPKIEVPKEQPEVVKTRIIETPKQETPKVEQPKEESNPKIEVKEIVKKEPEPKVETPKVEQPKKVASTNEFNEEYEELFLFKEATDISQKLSESPILDLTKALGLNEKFLFINELFGGDAAKFKAAIDVFNEPMDSFDKARAYMEKELVEQFDWLNKLKKTVAKDFVKLVRRRYL